MLVNPLDLLDLHLGYLGGLGFFELESLIGVELGEVFKDALEISSRQVFITLSPSF